MRMQTGEDPFRRGKKPRMKYDKLPWQTIVLIIHLNMTPK